MNLLGEELKRAREAKNITINDIFARTKIQPKFIEAIERGELDILPQAYIRAFLRSYAKCVNLDPNEVLHKYELALAGTYTEETEIPQGRTRPTVTLPQEQPALTGAEEIPAEVKSQPAESQPSVMPTEEVHLWISRHRVPIISALALLIVAIAIFSVLYFGSEKPPSPVSQAPIVSPAESSHTAKDTLAVLTKELPTEPSGKKSDGLLTHQPMTPTESTIMVPSLPKKEMAKVTLKPEAVASVKSDSIILGGITTGNVLVRVSIDGSANRDYSLQPNMRRTWKAKERIVISLSDAGAMSFTLNGKKIGKLGKSGTIMRDVTVYKKGIRRP